MNKNSRSLSVKAKLNILNIVIIISGIVGVIGAFEIAKGAKLHELNFLHVKYNHVFLKNVNHFNNNTLDDISILSSNIRDIRQQPIDCLKIATWFERSFMKIIGTYDAIQLCQDDLELGNKTLSQVRAYANKQLTRNQLLAELDNAVLGFNKNSELFEPFVSRTVSLVLQLVIALIAFKAIIVTLIGMLLSRSLGDDYRKLAETEASLEEHTNKLEEKNSALEQFSYHTSHDLKSPLTSIRGLTQFVAKDIRDGNLEEASKNTLQIEQLACRGEELIKDILAITRSDTLWEEAVKVNVDQMIRDITKQLSVQTKEKQIRIIHNHTYTDTLYCRAIRLQHVLENLLSNAIKYSDPNSSDKLIETIVESKGAELLIHVKDNGLGIPQAQHHRVFKMFSRFHRESANGSGLGLYLVKKHVAQINGMINFASGPGDTCFTVSLPITK